MDDFPFAAVVNFLSLTSYSFSSSMSLKIAFLLKKCIFNNSSDNFNDKKQFLMKENAF